MKTSTVVNLLNDLDNAVPANGGYLKRTAVPDVPQFKFIMRYSSPENLPIMPQVRRTLDDCCEGCGQKILGTEWLQAVLAKYGIPSDKIDEKFEGKSGCAITGYLVIKAITEVIDEQGL